MYSSGKKTSSSVAGITKASRHLIKNFNDLLMKNTRARNDVARERKQSSRNADPKIKSDVELRARARRGESKSPAHSDDKHEPLYVARQALSKASFHQLDKLKKSYAHSESSIKLPSSRKLDGAGRRAGKASAKATKDNALSIYLNDTKNAKNLVFQSNKTLHAGNFDLKVDKTVGNFSLSKQTSAERRRGKYIFQSKLELKNYRIKEKLKNASLRNIDYNLTINHSSLYPLKREQALYHRNEEMRKSNIENSSRKGNAQRDDAKQHTMSYSKLQLGFQRLKSGSKTASQSKLATSYSLGQTRDRACAEHGAFLKKRAAASPRRSLQPPRVLALHTNTVVQSAVTARALYTLSLDMSLGVFGHDAALLQHVRTQQRPTSFCVGEGAGVAAISAQNCYTRLYRLGDEGGLAAVARLHSRPVLDSKIVDRTLYSVSLDGTLKTFDVGEGRAGASLALPAQPSRLQYSSSYCSLLMVDAACKTYIYDSRAGKLQSLRLSVPAAMVAPRLFELSSNSMFVLDCDRRAVLFDLRMIAEVCARRFERDFTAGCFFDSRHLVLGERALHFVAEHDLSEREALDCGGGGTVRTLSCNESALLVGGFDCGVQVYAKKSL